MRAHTANGALPPNDWFHDLVIRALINLGGEAERQAIYHRARKLADFSPAQRAVPPAAEEQGRIPRPDRI
jgi:hypothetical protein